MYGGGTPWGKIHADRRAREAQDDASRARREVAAWKARSEAHEVLVYELADQAHPVHVEEAPNCRCRGCCGELLKEIRARYSAP